MPQNYNFVYFSNGSSASAANLYYFEISHALTNPYWLGDCEKYIKDYTLLLHHKNEYIFLSFHPLVSTKNLFLFNKKVDMYYIARDPIEKLQHGINHTENGLIDEEIAKNPLSKRFNLTCDYNNLFVTPFYRLGSKVPQMQALDDEWIYKSYIAFSSYLKIWRNLGLINNVYCVDFKDFSKEKAFDTFAKVANHFHFTPPSDKKIFNDRINRNRGVLINLPTTLVAANSDIANAFCNGSENTQNLASLDSKDSLNIHIGTYQDFITNGSFIDISSEFFTEKIIIDKTQILIFMLKSEYFILRENALLLKACKNYLHGYIDTLKNKVKETQSHLISEDSIIEYLRNNKTLREKIKNIMDVELSFFKENYPQMVASWEYYQKFEAMCKGMRHYEQSNPNNGDSKTDSNNFIESKNLDSIENIESKNLQNPKLDSKNIIESKTITPPPVRK
ncbi:DUF2972 domain-containing protein [Helicobacter saguini]|uniref:DUF2972 domain-containing protein n=1 Tax=Helicobacter saguini TaxID=1548018 RepID=A0A347VRR9_9HELI|nr:DUF2972 domain-containing protein [Helicobacter saguini]MWV62799.1 DUF2972 domain-containing protein [Helicobacter saguini]MWV66532.1 DUF2972 domain-containing protein [Helicobacter saguini]TLD93657.1 DUF2972 domain-containing protein [Helicobacter saguini]